MGLIVAGRNPSDPDDRWENGITYEPECVPDSGTPLDACDPAEVDTPSANATVAWDPYFLQVGYNCGTFGWKGRDWQALVRRRLAADEERQLSAELWRGALARAEGYPNRFLASAAADVLTDGATGLTDGLACLEQYLAECNGGQQGMIHATTQVVDHWLALGHLLRREGNVLYTNSRDTIVVPGAGYDGSGPQSPQPLEGQGTPEAAAEGSVWAYVTGIIEVRLGRVDVLGGPDQPAQMDRTGNSVDLIAERAALASWDLCCHGAVELDVSLCSAGGVS